MFGTDKDRLCIAHYMRGGTPRMPGGEDKFHWAILVIPKTENEATRGRRFHAKENTKQYPFVWEYTEEDTGTVQTLRLLSRTIIGKVKNMEILEEILRRIPIRAGQVEGWNCVAWVREALDMLEQNGKATGTAILDWPTVREACMRYTQGKINSHRFDGKATYAFKMERPATYDLLENKEVISCGTAEINDGVKKD